MLLKHIKLFGAICHQAEFFNSTSTHWNSNCQKLELCSNHTAHAKAVKLNWLLHFLATVILCLNGVYYFLLKSEIPNAFTDIFLYAFALAATIATNAFLYSGIQNPDSVCLYVNGVVTFSKTTGVVSNHTKLKENNFLYLINLVFAYGWAGSLVPLPFLYLYGLHWLNPCKPAIVAYSVIPQCFQGNMSTGDITGFANSCIKIIVLVLNHWVWALGCSIGSFGISGLMILCIQQLCDCLKR